MSLGEENLFVKLELCQEEKFLDKRRNSLREENRNFEKYTFTRAKENFLIITIIVFF